MLSASSITSCVVSGMLLKALPVTFRLKRTVALVGMMGSGKTAVGGALSRILGVELRDMYGRLIDTGNGATGTVRSGGDASRGMERAANHHTLHPATTGKGSIVSVGGRIVERR